jgi:YD repeat-containing protein
MMMAGASPWTRAATPTTGQTESTNFPLAYPAQSTYNGGDNDAFATKLNAPNRVTRYTYDGVLRLISVIERPGKAYRS